MKEQAKRSSAVGALWRVSADLDPSPPSTGIRIGRRARIGFRAIALLLSVSIQLATGRNANPQSTGEVTIHGKVEDLAGNAIGGALVRLEQKGAAISRETKTGAAGVFTFTDLVTGTYIVSAKSSGWCSRPTEVVASAAGEQREADLVLEDAAAIHSDSCAASATQAPVMEFTDKPDFTVAGVTDWTAAGGHGSDTSLRTSEALTRETLTLKADGRGTPASTAAGDANESESKLRADLAGEPGSFKANHQLGEFYLHADRVRESIPLLEAAFRIDPQDAGNEYDLALALKEAGDFSMAHEHAEKLLAHGESADLHRLAAEIDEKSGDPLAAVHEYEQAVRMDPSEENYFEWGSELLLHRAVWQAQEVFQKGVQAYPKSARMLTALGTALFGGARYDEAANRLCEASDLNPADAEPYIFMGKIEMVAPNPLPCIEQKLARFAELQPGNALASYFYAMAIWKDQPQPADPQAVGRVEALLTKAVTVDTKCSDAYLQLGVLYASQRNFEKAIGFYSKAIEANPDLAEAHYRLGVAYDRVGEPAKAKLEFQLHDKIKKLEADAVERQRREIKQFLVVAPGEPANPRVN
jgi:tetratricopeptide (TPR) repeat protein